MWWMHDAKRVHEESCSISRTRHELHVREAQLLVFADELEIWHEFGCMSLLEYLERFCDLHPRTGREYVRVARALTALPHIRAELGARRISYSTVRELTRIATPEKEVDWLREVAGMTARELEERLAGHKRGDGPTTPKEPNRLVKLTLDVRPSTMAAFMEARSNFRDEHGERLSDDEVVMAMCTALPPSNDDDWEDDGDDDSAHTDHARADNDSDNDNDSDAAAQVDVLVGARDARANTPPPFQLSLTTCRCCAKTFLLAAGRQVEVAPSMRAAAQCDAIHIGDLESDAPQRAVSSVTPRIRRQVLARDEYRCTVPGCRSKRFLQLHHIVPQANGGPHKPSNITTLCFGHHDGLHDGKLVVRGHAPYALDWVWPADPERTARCARRPRDYDAVASDGDGGGAAHVGRVESPVGSVRAATPKGQDAATRGMS